MLKIFSAIIFAAIFLANNFAQAALAESVNNFSWKYFKTRNHNLNIFYSPYSIAAALGMVANGASGDTQREILDALNSDSLENLNDEFKNFQGATAANLLLIDKKYSGNGINSNFKNTAENFYRSEVALADFENDLTGEQIKITGWVKKHTNNFIPNYQSIASKYTSVDLLNVTYFKEDWLYAFRKSGTREKIFTNKDGSTCKVQMMRRTFDEEIPYYADGKYKGVALPYKNSGAAMFVILPVDENNLNIADDWDAESFSYRENFLNQIKSAGIFDGEIYLDLPKFELDLGDSLPESLWKVGIQRAFTDYAQFYNIINGVSLKIDDAAHQAKIRVDETGTEAAAVTEITMVETTAVAPDFKRSVEFRADRPFFFVIRDVESGVDLFAGAVNNLD